jgi:hypothetical protein
MFFCAMAYSQMHTDTVWKNQINEIFEHVDKSKIPTGILLDYAMEFTNVSAHNGTLTDSTEVTANVFGNIYKTLLMGKVTNDTTHFPPFRQVAKKWANRRHESNPDDNNVVLLSGLLYEYAKFAPDAYENGKIDVIDNKYYDKYVNGILQDPYITDRTFAVAAPVRKMNGYDMWVKLPQDLFLSNMPLNGTKIEADFNDGKGYQQIAFNQMINVVYTTEGKKTWRFKFTRGAHLFESFLTMDVFDFHDFITPMATSVSGAKLRIDYASADNKLMKPLIVAEGFDPGTILTPENAGGDTTLDDFVESLVVSDDLFDLLNGDTQQYDIIYIDWDNGTDNIKNNSKVLRDVIIKVNEVKALNGSTEKNVLLGQSMGGLIGRYTLAKMEKENDEPHDVRLFIAHDSPMQGANTPMSIQYLSRHMYNEYGDSSILYNAIEHEIPGILDFIGTFGSSIAFPSLEDVLTLQDTPAAMQMNYFYVDIDSNPSLLPHLTWQTEFDAMGYPEQSTNIAISNGNECAPDNGFSAGDDLLNIDDDHNPDFWGDLLHMLITPTIGVIFDDFNLQLLGTLPGSSKYIFDFDVRSNPALNDSDRLVYHGKITYTKRLFWIGGKVTYTLTEDNGWSPNEPGYLPYDTYSGGQNNLEDIVEDYLQYLPSNTLVNPIYGFIPVVSALDIHRDNGPITGPDYQLHYNKQTMPDPTLHSGFDDFIVGHNNGVQHNFPHISFQERNGDWLAAKLEGTTIPAPDCTFVCDATTITGPDIVCGSGNFSAPPGSGTYTWWVTPAQAGNITSGQGTINSGFTFNNNVNGYITINVSMNAPGCGTFVTSKTIWRGRPSTPGITGQNHVANNSLVGYATGADGATYYQWTLPGGAVMVANWNLGTPYWQMLINDCTGPTLRAYTGTGGFTGYVTATGCNACGCGETGYFQVYANDSGGMGLVPMNPTTDMNSIYSVSPNPAGQQLNIQLRDPAIQPATTQITAKLYNFYGAVVAYVSVTNNKAALDVAALPIGVYTLQIDINGSIEPHKVIVAR